MVVLSCVLSFFSFFFFKQKTAYEMRISDWSSDVCSSDLGGASGYSQTVECARITEGGNLGIGTGAPVSRLHVKSNNEIARLETTVPRGVGQGFLGFADPTDRKSTRLNSSH